MCDFNNLSNEEKLYYHQLILDCANNYGGINFFLQLIEKLREVSPHPLSSRHQDFLFDLGNIRWNKTIFQDKIELIETRRKNKEISQSFLPNKEDKSYKRTLNLIKTLSPIVFSVRPALRDDGEGFDFKAFNQMDNGMIALNPIFEILFFCSIETVKKILNYK
jgi:hypothetical protein